ncbi:hypothetical protein AC578_1121 [Pseudocercospora eumusae]|uniref:Uncharacterized protein n=1 Tax=Pseudocercospora eumusae TaxID=321146 RepID=A0A139GXL4_9PEZI|nr:hypothetical protein AC578_1121 [Pseudocercospora eumusae]
MIDARTIAFFTRVLFQTLNDDENSIEFIKQVYGKRRLQAIMSRAEVLVGTLPRRTITSANLRPQSSPKFQAEAETSVIVKKFKDIMARGEDQISMQDLYGDEEGRNSLAYNVMGEVWCMDGWNSTIGKVDGLGYVNGRTLYWEAWVMGWRIRQNRREFVHEAWGNE